MKRIKPRNLILLAIIVLALLFGAWSRYNLSSPTLEKGNSERTFNNQDHQQKPAKPFMVSELVGESERRTGMYSGIREDSERTFNNQDHQQKRFKTATVFSQPRTVPPFSLVDDKNKSFTLNNLKGQWNLIFFGFTHCPGLCPTTLSTLNKTYQLLETYHLKQVPQIIFISVDPEQDDIKTIQKYLKGFNPKFIGVTGNPKEIDKLTQALSVLYMKVDKSDSKEGYTIDHSGTILIINPEGQFVGVFTMPHDASIMAQDIKLLLSSS